MFFQLIQPWLGFIFHQRRNLNLFCIADNVLQFPLNLILLGESRNMILDVKAAQYVLTSVTSLI